MTRSSAWVKWQNADKWSFKNAKRWNGGIGSKKSTTFNEKEGLSRVGFCILFGHGHGFMTRLLSCVSLWNFVVIVVGKAEISPTTHVSKLVSKLCFKKYKIPPQVCLKLSNGENFFFIWFK